VEGYFEIATRISVFDNPIYLILICLAIMIANYFCFHYNNNWKIYKTEFEKWPKKRNSTGGLVVFLIVLSILGNLIFMFYLYSKVKWGV
jgi:purine-cytosine permease-like protein